MLKILVELETGSWRDAKDRNVPAMRSYLADEAVLIFCDGTRFTKSEFLKALPTFRIDSFDVDRASAEIRIATPDVATLLYRVTYTQDKTVTVLASNTYVRRQGKWTSMLYQETQVK